MSTEGRGRKKGPQRWPHSHSWNFGVCYIDPKWLRSKRGLAGKIKVPVLKTGLWMILDYPGRPDI